MSRVCPNCLKLNEDETVRCECGYAFETTEEPVGSRTAEVVRQADAEDQYENFYAARLQQVQAEVKSLIVRYGKSGWTPAQRAEIGQAIEKVEQAKAELEAQHRRADDAKNHLEQAKKRVEIRRTDAMTKKRSKKSAPEDTE